MACILVVDDEEPVRSLLQKLLEREGHHLHVAPDGEKALEIYEEIIPDLVITDLVMPRMNGLQMIRRLLDTHACARIIAISGGSNNDGQALLASAKSLGAKDTLAKPFGREELLLAVERSLARA